MAKITITSHYEEFNPIEIDVGLYNLERTGPTRLGTKTADDLEKDVLAAINEAYFYERNRRRV